MKIEEVREAAFSEGKSNWAVDNDGRTSVNQSRSSPALSPSSDTAFIRIEPSRGWFSVKLSEMWQYRELVYFLTWRDIKVRRKQTVLGTVFRKKCLGKMGEVAEGGRVGLFVSHNMEPPLRLCSRAIWLHSGGKQADGPTGQVVRKYMAASLE